MFQETKREGKGWRFDWINDRGDLFKGLRYYPETDILSTWSRKPHRMAKNKYHHYRINDNDWAYIKLACLARWPNQIAHPIKGPQAPVKLIELEVEISGVWRDEAFCRTITKGSIREWGAKNKFPVREK